MIVVSTLAFAAATHPTTEKMTEASEVLILEEAVHVVRVARIKARIDVELSHRHGEEVCDTDVKGGLLASKSAVWRSKRSLRLLFPISDHVLAST